MLLKFLRRMKKKVELFNRSYKGRSLWCTGGFNRTIFVRFYMPKHVSTFWAMIDFYLQIHEFWFLILLFANFYFWAFLYFSFFFLETFYGYLFLRIIKILGFTILLKICFFNMFTRNKKLCGKNFHPIFLEYINVSNAKALSQKWNHCDFRVTKKYTKF